jgi:hypothetical protein
MQLDAYILSTTLMKRPTNQHSSAYSADDATGSLLHQPMAVERRERRLKGNLIPPEAGLVLNTRPVKAAGYRSRATPAWPLGVTSTSRVDRRDDGSPPERRSGQGGACAARTVMTTRCPLSAGLPRSWPGSGWHPKRWARSGGNATGHDRGAGGRLGRVASGQTVAEEPGVHLRHQRPVVFGQHHSTD